MQHKCSKQRGGGQWLFEQHKKVHFSFTFFYQYLLRSSSAIQIANTEYWKILTAVWWCQTAVLQEWKQFEDSSSSASRANVQGRQVLSHSSRLKAAMRRQLRQTPTSVPLQEVLIYTYQHWIMLIWFGHSDIMRCIRILLTRKTEFSATFMSYQCNDFASRRRTGAEANKSSRWYFTWEMFYKDLIIFSAQLLHKSLPRRHAHCSSRPPHIAPWPILQCAYYYPNTTIPLNSHHC